MKEVEVKLRRGMDRNGIRGQPQDRIVQAITSFALYGFPESHAASFALLAYASAYLKCHYLAAFTAALLNNQPMGFYHPSTIIKDAQRHGLTIKPVDVTRSEWACTVVDPNSVRLGLRYVKGLREEAARAIVRRRPYASIDELARRVPELRKDEMTKLAEVGALNFIQPRHRRDALWDTERAARPAGPLFEGLDEGNAASPLASMTAEERLDADYRGTGLTLGPHPMAYRRAEMSALGVTRASDLDRMRNGRAVRVAGCVIVRQRPGTANGFVFLSLEDETGITNVIVPPDTFASYRLVLVEEPFLFIEGVLQHQDRVVSVKAQQVCPLPAPRVAGVSHDFH
jgi:error-prone DNA polymerase